MSQSNYPLKTVINGDSVVILTKGQADTINIIFEGQKKKIADAKAQVVYLDSILKRKDSLLRTGTISIAQYNALQAEYANTLMFLDYIENWVLERAKEGAWLYYSYDSLWVEAVDLSPYKVRKDDVTGDLFFYRVENCPEIPDHRDKKDYPKRGWDKEIVLTNRPKIKKL